VGGWNNQPVTDHNGCFVFFFFFTCGAEQLILHLALAECVKLHSIALTAPDAGEHLVIINIIIVLILIYNMIFCTFILCIIMIFF